MVQLHQKKDSGEKQKKTGAQTYVQTWRMTAAARGVVGVRVAEDDSMGSALAEDAIAFSAAWTIAADAYELLLLPLSALPAHESSKHELSLQSFLA